MKAGEAVWRSGWLNGRGECPISLFTAYKWPDK